MAWVTRYRAGHARALLRDGVPPAVVAHRVGYATEAAFRRAFRRVTGVTPGAFRKAR